jgi:hypothetical protein
LSHSASSVLCWVLSEIESQELLNWSGIKP